MKTTESMIENSLPYCYTNKIETLRSSGKFASSCVRSRQKRDQANAISEKKGPNATAGRRRLASENWGHIHAALFPPSTVVTRTIGCCKET